MQKIQKELSISKIKELEFAKHIGGKLGTKVQDIKEHTDIVFETGIDYKQIKKIRRSDSEVNENFHWVEIKNVVGGDGWLYAGKNKYIAFELRNWVALIDKSDLQDFITKYVIPVYPSEIIPYHLYRRADRDDLMILIPSIDLCAIAIEIIPKPKYKH